MSDNCLPNLLIFTTNLIFFRVGGGLRCSKKRSGTSYLSYKVFMPMESMIEKRIPKNFKNAKCHEMMPPVMPFQLWLHWSQIVFGARAVSYEFVVVPKEVQIKGK